MQGLARLESRESAKEDGPAKKPDRLDGPWLPSCSRPPLTSSTVGNTVVVLMAMQAYATKSQRPEVEKAIQRANAWLSRAPLEETEDHVWRLWGLELLGGNAAAKEETRSALRVAQNKDGGWSQTREMASDAYATGQVLYILLTTGTSRDAPLARRAATYLVRTQERDGSWLVKSRIKIKTQPYVDNGDPHGEHQFLSVAATSWASAALSRMSSLAESIDDDGSSARSGR
jgi:N-acyl-D-amino-acid deacylase